MPAETQSLETLEVEQCLDLLSRNHLGRLAYLLDGRPRIVPLTFLYHEGSIVFRINYGSLLDAIHGAHVAFEVDGYDAADRWGWSVVVHGRAEEVWEQDDLDTVRQLPLRPWAPGEREHYVRLSPSSITGRGVGMERMPAAD